MYKNISEIILKTKYITNKLVNKDYIDELKINNKTIKYIRKVNLPKKDLLFWNCSYEFNDKWDNLKKVICDEFINNNEIQINDNIISYELKIIFDDDTFKVINRNGDFYINNMIELAEAFIDIIPSGNIFSFLLAPFYPSRFSENNINMINYNKIDAVMYSEVGAMISGGYIEIVTKDRQIINADTLFKNSIIKQDDILNMFDNISNDNIAGYITINNDLWFYYYLGVGSHLYR